MSSKQLQANMKLESGHHKPTGQKTPSTPTSFKLGLYVVVGYVAVAASWLLSHKLAQPTPLAGVYALCSREGAKIYTVDSKLPNVQCVVVHNSTIVDRGSLADVNKRFNGGHKSGTKTLTVRFIPPGAIVVPGMSDSHGHILEYGASALIPLEAANSVTDAVGSIKEYVLANLDVFNDTAKIIDGWGWDQTKWNDEMPTSDALEAEPVLRGRKIVLQSKDGHALWVSHAVIKGLGELPESYEAGYITRDSQGKPAGVLVDKAQDLIVRPPLTDEDLYRRFVATVKDAHRYGLTSIHDAGFSPVSVEFFSRQANKAPLPIRIYGMRYFDENGYWGDKMEKRLDQGRLTVRSVKIFADGALRTGGAALYEPYSDNHHTMGLMRITPELLFDVVPRFLRDGWQVNIHAIGDRANSIVLDAFEAALHGANVTNLRPRLEHAQIMTKVDMDRLANLGVIASIQPTHATDDMWYAEDRLGPERIKNLYAFRSLIDSGARVTFGSDFPVEPLNPLLGFYAAISRLTPSGDSPHGKGGWFPNQRLSRQEALEGITIAPAYASFSESVLGSLEIGKRADYVVLSQDIMTAPIENILQTTVHATVIDGHPVYGEI